VLSIYPFFADAFARIYHINGPTITLSGGGLEPRGLHSANRSGATAAQAYWNGSSVATDSADNSAYSVYNFPFIFGGGNGTRSPSQFSAGGFGQSLNSTEQLALYNRIHVYMQDIAGFA